MRRGAVQALVREAYLVTVAEQDSEHRPPAAFTQVWRARLVGLLDQASVDLPGWAPITITCPDTDLAWRLFELANRARQDALEHAIATPSQRVQRGQQVPTFEFSIATDGSSLGDVTYGSADPAASACCTRSGCAQTGSSAGSGVSRSASLKPATPT